MKMLAASIDFKIGIFANESFDCLVRTGMRTYGQPVMTNAVFDDEMVAAALGARTTLLGAAVIGAVVTLAAYFLPGMRSIERRTPPSPEASPLPPANAPAASLR